jgi:Kef-type K+ transport system membrane component KefB
MSVLMFGYIAFAGAVAAAMGFGDLQLRLGLVILFVLVSWFAVRPLLMRVYGDRPNVSPDGMAVAFGGMMLFGLIAHLLGINALVGGFIWGMVFPDNQQLRKAVAEKFRDVAMVFLLPVFFALAGFASDLKLLTLETLGAVALLLLGAIGGKFLAAAPGRAFGLTWNEVGVLGALFNARGLLVLVVGLIGLDLHIINNLTFTIIVVVALVTNLMTLPLLNLFSVTPAAPQAVPPVGRQAPGE